ncbi:hypothetical protein [Amycolatopsis magusensis]|uniref:hypothetical protein n=1 Tax=Amycolatopsis magusensis TaxID=882444 RepID=UPI0024A81A20|nr:hypothetical protein [Amycolatopsis magusensis]MDI5979030.1 hypothetical protein [Amycolatopsis magusensis]
MSEESRSYAARHPLSALQAELSRPRMRARFDAALRSWSQHDPALAEIADHAGLVEVLSSRDYPRQDEVLFTLLRRAATLGDEGIVASKIVVNAMIPAVPGIVGRVIRASRAALATGGPRRGVTGAGVSAAEENADVQAMVVGHLWEQVRCYPLRRPHHVAINLVRETQRAALRELGVNEGQPAAEVVSIDDDAFHAEVTQRPAEPDASVEVLELLAWAVEQKRLDEQAAAILIARYFGHDIGRDGVATDRQIAALLGVSQPTATRRRQRALAQLVEAAWEFPGLGHWREG